jgi:sphinganine-1-phosphate aldolase
MTHTLVPFRFIYFCLLAYLTKKASSSSGRQDLLRLLLQLAQRLPFVKDYVEKKKAKLRKEIRDSILENDPKTYDPVFELPEEGFTGEAILNIVQKTDVSKRLSGTVYGSSNEERDKIVSEVMSRTLFSNPLHADTFPLIRRMEGEIISMVGRMFNMPSTGGGVTTSGGTESIIMACRAYTTGKYKPEVIVAETAHAAFDKAADLMGFKLVKVHVNPNTFKMCLDSLKKHITCRTSLIVASMPNFPQGVIDPIEDIAKICVRKGIPLHVDACLGGFLVPFLRFVGHDFRVQGITSISVDPHKYGCTPKGVSVLLYRDTKVRQKQYFMYPDWTGGMYVTPTIPGSRSGCLIAATWATLVHTGCEQYRDSAEHIQRATLQVHYEMSKLKELEVLGKPHVNVVAFRCKSRSIFALNDLLHEKGWSLNILQNPDSLHLCLTGTNYAMADKFVEDMKVSVVELLELPEDYKLGASAVYGMASSIPDRSMVKDVLVGYMDSTLSPPEQTS